MPADLSELTDLHLLILGALCAGGEMTIAQVHAAVRHRGTAAAKTIATLLLRLEQRGLVTHRLEAREGVYRALVTRRELLVARVSGMLGSLFAAEEGAAEGPAAVAPDEVQDGDAQRLRELLRRAERDLDES
jgi:predicted transcriptional regulator